MLAAGAVFIVLENTYYQYLDENGVLHESLFLPLGALSVVFGLLLVTVHFAALLWRLARDK
ncbi:MAG: DUF3955 domain-containing protein [Gammaproteobacteria bacterium]|nr:DUF3955 domain-containing protein [Gammaproteobacteria bacterium]